MAEAVSIERGTSERGYGPSLRGRVRIAGVVSFPAASLSSTTTLLVPPRAWIYAYRIDRHRCDLRPAVCQPASYRCTINYASGKTPPQMRQLFVFRCERRAIVESGDLSG